MKAVFLKIVDWFKQSNHVLLLAILILASYMRLYKISEYMVFLGDEGRDALVARSILQGDFVFIGPRASAGDFFLGPIYYYFMAPFLWITDYDPVGPAIMVALLGVTTTFLVYIVGKEFFGKWAGLSAAALYAISPLVVVYSRSSWNPNPVPFFTLLMMYWLYLGVKRKALKYFLLAGASYGILIQLHYIVVFLAFIVIMYVLLADIVTKKSFKFFEIIKRFALFTSGFVITFSPFLAFEFKNGFPNFKTIFKFIFDTTTQGGNQGMRFSDIVVDIFTRLFSKLLLRFPETGMFEYYSQIQLDIWKITAIVLALVTIIVLFFSKNKLVILLCSLWLFFGIILFGFYKKPIYEYYFGFLFPLPFLLFGNVIEEISGLKKRKPLGSVVAILLFAAMFIFLVKNPPTHYRRNNQLQEAKNISQFILDKADDKPFNFALVTKGNSDHAFRYFFETSGNPPVVIENLDKDPNRKSVTDQLFVLCDFKDCGPLGYPLWEAAGFGRAEIVEEWPVVHFTVYKLKHYQE